MRYLATIVAFLLAATVWSFVQKYIQTSVNSVGVAAAIAGLSMVVLWVGIYEAWSFGKDWDMKRDRSEVRLKGESGEGLKNNLKGEVPYSELIDPVLADAYVEKEGISELELQRKIREGEVSASFSDGQLWIEDRHKR